MNTNSNSPPKKRHHHSFDSDMPPFGLPRKKFISEESFAKDMAAMSLDAQNTYFEQHQAQHHNSNESSLDEDDDDEEEEENNIMLLDSHGNQPIIDIDQNGLPMELRPGENKLRIPQFVLENPELLDPRDKLAYQNMMKSLHNNNHHKQVRIEVLNNPSDHFTPTSMDID